MQRRPMRWGMRGVAARLALLAGLALGSGSADAVPVTVTVEYLTLAGQSCIRAFCTPIAPGGTFQKTFEIDSALLATPGSYDVRSTLAPPFVFPPGTSSSQHVANAVVAGGTVVDLFLDYLASGSNTVPIIGTTFFSNTFDASGGSWTSTSSASNSLSNSSSNSSGTYTVTVVPEPGALALVASGLLGLGTVRRRR